jgi:hypothetical protein
MLTVPQIESLRTTNPQLYEALKRLAEASLGPNQGWSLDDQITDGSLFARVTSGALTGGKVDPAKSGVLMKGSVPPTWSGAFTYVSTTATMGQVAREHGFTAKSLAALCDPATGLAIGCTVFAANCAPAQTTRCTHSPSGTAAPTPRTPRKSSPASRTTSSVGFSLRQRKKRTTPADSWHTPRPRSFRRCPSVAQAFLPVPTQQ